MMETNLAYEIDPEVKTELIGGRVVAMASPKIRHTRVVNSIYGLFRDYLRGKPCEPFEDNVDVHLTRTDRYIPDVTVVCDPDKITDDGIFGAPDLVVEVLSPSTGKNDKSVKKDVYERCGVREYWIVDPVSLTIDQYVLEDGKFVLRDMYTKYRASMMTRMTDEDKARLVTEFPCGIFPDLMVRLDDVFERVVDLPL